MSVFFEMESRKLKYAATINDEALPESTNPDHELRYIDIGNVDSQGIIHDIVRYRFEEAPSRARRIVRDGDVIVSTVRTYLQAIAPIENPPADLVVSTGFAVVRPRMELLDREFCKYVLREKHFLWEVESRSVGVSYPAINASELGEIKINIPPLDIQRIIASYLERETDRIDSIVSEVGGRAAAAVAKPGSFLERLLERRSALITAAVTGQIPPEEMAA